MTLIDTKLYELFSDKTCSEWCLFIKDSILYRVPKSINIWDWVSWEAISWTYWSTISVKIKDIKILWHEPQLHDVVRIMQMSGINLYQEKEKIIIFQDSSVSPIYVPYNPTLSLINQEESTKQAIVDLFSN